MTYGFTDANSVIRYDGNYQQHLNRSRMNKMKKLGRPEQRRVALKWRVVRERNISIATRTKTTTAAVGIILLGTRRLI
jgi:hypothetical protein